MPDLLFLVTETDHIHWRVENRLEDIGQYHTHFTNHLRQVVSRDCRNDNIGINCFAIVQTDLVSTIRLLDSDRR